MSKKRKSKRKKHAPSAAVQDFTINDCANAEKLVTKLKKSATQAEPQPDLAWDQLDDEFDIIEKINEDGTTSIVYEKKGKPSRTQTNVDEDGTVVYPEIVWYHISKYIEPEDVGHFAGINKATYAMAKCESFWRLLYNKYCANCYRSPPELKLEYDNKAYGLRQRVIRALYQSYKLFKQRVVQKLKQDSDPHSLTRRCCVNVWFYKGPKYWMIYFKFKKSSSVQRLRSNTGAEFIEEMGRVDANPEEDCKVLQVTCHNLYEVPPVMGLTLSSVTVVLSQGFRHHRLQLGFNSGLHVSKDILPECTVLLDTVVNMAVFDWWHPMYPFNNNLPSNLKDDESMPMYKKDFFNISEDELM